VDESFPVMGAFGGAAVEADGDPGAFVDPILVPAPPPILPGEAPPPPIPRPEPEAATTTTTSVPPSSTTTATTAAGGGGDGGGGGATSTTAASATSTTAASTTTTTAAPTTTTSTSTTTTSTTTPSGGTGTTFPVWSATVVAIADPVADLVPIFATIFRFFDLCAETGGQGCPPGVGGTVLYEGGKAPPPPLKMDVIPEPTQAIRDQVRCDLAWPSSKRIPVLITSNRPLDLFHTTLSIEGGATVHEVNNGRSDPSEFARYEQLRKDGKPVGTTLGNAIHTCVAFDIEAASAPANVSRTGRFEVAANGFAGQSHAKITRAFGGDYKAGKPPIKIHALDGYRAMVVVPQRRDDIVTTSMFIDHDAYGTAGPGPCTPNTSKLYHGQLTPRSPSKGPIEYSVSDMNAADYPYDRDYTHYTVWDLYLTSGSGHVLCVGWQEDDAHELWHIETPNLWQFNLWGRVLHYNSFVKKGSLTLRVPGINDCWVANPGQGSAGGRDPFPDEGLSHTSGWEFWFLPDSALCSSNGWRYPDPIEVWAELSEPGDNTVYGVARIPVAALMKDCKGDRAAPVQSSDDGCKGPTVEWRNQNVLCGGPIATGNCQGDLFRSLATWTVMRGDSRWDRTTPKDWLIAQIPP